MLCASEVHDALLRNSENYTLVSKHVGLVPV